MRHAWQRWRASRCHSNTQQQQLEMALRSWSSLHSLQSAISIRRSALNWWTSDLRDGEAPTRADSTNSQSDDFRWKCCQSCSCEPHRLLNEKWLLMVEQRVVAVDTASAAGKKTYGASRVQTGRESSGVMGFVQGLCRRHSDASSASRLHGAAVGTNQSVVAVSGRGWRDGGTLTAGDGNW